jgi:phosphoribosylaminoimidazole carboxylase
LKKHGIRVAEYSAVSSEADVAHAIDVFGLPLMLKARKLAYDGRGNYVIKSKEDIRNAIAKLSPSGDLYVEKWVPFTKELAVMVARSSTSAH